MEGVITCGVAIFAISFIVKFPDEEKKKPSWGFLKPRELDLVIDRLNADRGDVEPEKFSWKKFLEPATVSSPLKQHLREPLLKSAGMVHLRLSNHSLPRHNNRLCFRLLPPHNPKHKPQIQHGHVPMPWSATLRLLRLPDVRLRVVQR